MQIYFVDIHFSETIHCGGFTTYSNAFIRADSVAHAETKATAEYNKRLIAGKWKGQDKPVTVARVKAKLALNQNPSSYIYLID